MMVGDGVSESAVQVEELTDASEVQLLRRIADTGKHRAGESGAGYRDGGDRQ